MEYFYNISPEISFHFYFVERKISEIISNNKQRYALIESTISKINLPNRNIKMMTIECRPVTLLRVVSEVEVPLSNALHSSITTSSKGTEQVESRC